MARGIGFHLRSHRNTSGIQGHYPEVPQKSKPGVHLNPRAQNGAILLRHAVSNLSLPALHRTPSSVPGEQRAPEETQSFLNFHTYLTNTRLCTRVLIQAAYSAAVTGDTIWKTPVAKLAAVTFISRVTFPTRTLPGPLSWGRNISTE